MVRSSESQDRSLRPRRGARACRLAWVTAGAQGGAGVTRRGVRLEVGWAHGYERHAPYGLVGAKTTREVRRVSEERQVSLELVMPPREMRERESRVGARVEASSGRVGPRTLQCSRDRRVRGGRPGACTTGSTGVSGEAAEPGIRAGELEESWEEADVVGGTEGPAASS